MLQAVIWDVDGTLAETERDGHRVAFNAAFEQAGLPWRWVGAQYGRLLSVTRGFERLLHDMQTRMDAPALAADRERLARALHASKNAAYARLVSEEGIALRPGVRALFDECAEAGIRMAIATTTSRSNVEALLHAQLGADWQRHFDCVLCAEDAPCKKPNPQVYRLALERLGLAAHEALAIEDSPAGVAAACAAGVPVVVTRSVYFADAPVDGASAAGPGLHTLAGWQPAAMTGDERVAGGQARVGIAQLAAWARRGAPVSRSREFGAGARLDVGG